MPPVVIIVALVGVVYLLVRGGIPLSPGGIAVASDLNANQRYAASTLPGIMFTAQQPDQSLGAAASGAKAGLGALQNYNQQQQDQGGGSTALGAAIPVIGAVVGIGFSLLAQHSARVKGATAENTGIDAIVPAIDADVREINAAYKAGSINANMAVTFLFQTRDQYWKYMAQFAGMAGVATRPCPPVQVGGPLTILAGFTSGTSGCVTGQPTCDKLCTAGCCVGCSAINGGIANQIWALQAGYHGPVGMCKVFGSKFGAHDRAAYQLTW